MKLLLAFSSYKLVFFLNLKALIPKKSVRVLYKNFLCWLLCLLYQGDNSTFHHMSKRTFKNTSKALIHVVLFYLRNNSK